jgi:hypothetical protein
MREHVELASGELEGRQRGVRAARRARELSVARRRVAMEVKQRETPLEFIDDQVMAASGRPDDVAPRALQYDLGDGRSPREALLLAKHEETAAQRRQGHAWRDERAALTKRDGRERTERLQALRRERLESRRDAEGRVADARELQHRCVVAEAAAWKQLGDDRKAVRLARAAAGMGST